MNYLGNKTSCLTINYYLPAARAALTPLGLSSNTKHFLGSIAGGSNLFAQTRLMSGKGLP